MRPAGRLIVAGTLLCGTLDLLDALLFSYWRSHTPAERVLQFIASGVEGKAAFAQGWTSAAAGVAVHYAISLCWVTLFVMLVRSVPGLLRWAAGFGVVYGLTMYAVMNFVVLPHTRAAARVHPHGVPLVNGVLALVVCFGLVLAWLCRRGVA